MVILGIDPALRCSGYSVIEADNPDTLRVVDCGVIRNPAKAPHSECLRRLAGGMRELAARFNPEAAAIESPFYGKNVKTAMILSMARGAILAALAECDIPVYAYSPRSAKQAISGSGRASKEQLANIIASLCGLTVTDMPLDATDAIALAICHANIVTRPEMRFLLPERL